MNDYSSSIATINERISSIQSRFGVRPPVTSSGSGASPTDGAGTDAAKDKFSALIDRLVSQSPDGGSSSVNDTIASILEQQTAPVSARSAAVTTVQDDQPEASGVDGQKIVDAAKKYLGIPYVWGGEDPSGFDCSGLIQYVYAQFGVDIPRVSRDQAKIGQEIPSLDQAIPGDLVAFGEPVDHIGIYAGDGKMVVAPHTGDVVKMQDVYKTPVTIRRILAPAAGTVAAPGGTSVAAAADISGGTAEDPAAPYRSMFRQAASKYGITADLLEAVAKQESRFNPNAQSPAGAQGLMQIMPATARALGVDPFDPAQAIDGSARLLSQGLRRFGSVSLALAAYNAGPGAVEKFGGVPPYRETQGYVAKIMADLADNQPSTDGPQLIRNTSSPDARTVLRPATLFTTPESATATSAPIARLTTTTASSAATSATTTAATTTTSSTTTATATAKPTPVLVPSTPPLAGTITAAAKTTTEPLPVRPPASIIPLTPLADTPKAVVWPTDTPTPPAPGAWGPNTQMQVLSSGGEGTVSWADSGLLNPASPEEVKAVFPNATGPVAKGVLGMLKNAGPNAMNSPAFRQTMNDVNRDALGLPNAPDVIPVQPPAAAPAAATASAPASVTAAPATGSLARPLDSTIATTPVAVAPTTATPSK